MQLPGAAFATPGPYRDGRIRTGDPCNPIAVRYRAAPRPENRDNKGFPRGREAIRLVQPEKGSRYRLALPPLRLAKSTGLILKRKHVLTQ